MELGIADQFEQRQAFEVLAPKLDGAQKRLVAERHMDVRVDRQNSFGHVGKDRLASRGLEAQAVDQRMQFLGDRGQRTFQGAEVVARIVEGNRLGSGARESIGDAFQPPDLLG